MIFNIGTVNPYSYGTFASGSASGKLYVPVNPMSVVYAQFDHISGIAARQGESGVSISKIQILNTLIEHLTAIKNQPKMSAQNLSDKQVDALIQNYQKQIQQAVHSTPYILSGAQPQSGVLFSINA
ncbi:MAG: hypothetical protein M0P01_06720 [Treponema sp.]|nr:hypothetical protein [Treponema sp.]